MNSLFSSKILLLTLNKNFEMRFLKFSSLNSGKVQKTHSKIFIQIKNNSKNAFRNFNLRTKNKISEEKRVMGERETFLVLVVG
jgi:hypothetical protein